MFVLLFLVGMVNSRRLSSVYWLNSARLNSVRWLKLFVWGSTMLCVKLCIICRSIWCFLVGFFSVNSVLLFMGDLEMFFMFWCMVV